MWLVKVGSADAPRSRGAVDIRKRTARKVPGLTTGVGLPEPATRPIEAKYRAILGPYLLHSRDIAGIFDPGTCAPIYLDWQSGEPSPRRDSILGSPIVMMLTNFVA